MNLQNKITIEMYSRGTESSPYYQVYAFDGITEMGSVIVYPHVDMQGRTRMTLLKVRPEYQGRGVARQLVEFVIGVCQKYGNDLILVASPLGKNSPVSLGDLHKFYSSLGFVAYESDELNIKMKYVYENN